MITLPYDADRIDSLVGTWIALHELIEKQGDQVPEVEAMFWAHEEIDSLCRKQPEIAWQLILLIISRTANEFVLENLAAGPLESLLAWHGEKFVDRVETQTAFDVRFKWVLGGVWKNLISDEIWMRIQRLAEE